MKPTSAIAAIFLRGSGQTTSVQKPLARGARQFGLGGREVGRFPAECGDPTGRRMRSGIKFLPLSRMH
jgi:hypothetical protein